MLPPQAPPAQVSPQEAAATAALRRLTDHEAWLLAQHGAMPQPPDAPAAGQEAAFLAAFDAAMAAPVDAGPGIVATPRTQALAAVLGAVMKDEAALRRLDGTLGVAAADTIRAWLAAGGAASGTQASFVRFGGTRYAGAIALHAAAGDGPAWLFLPDAGWEAFPSLAQLHAVVARRFREQAAHGDELPGMAADAVRAAVAGGVVDTDPASGDVLGTLAADIIGVQRARAAAAWQYFNDGLLTATGLGDALRDAVGLHHAIDVTRILARRDRLLFDEVHAGRLAQLPSGVADAWRVAFHAYQAEVTGIEQAMADGHAPFPASLDAFARAALQQRLQARGLSEAVDDIELVVRDTTPPSSILGYLWQPAAATREHPANLLQLAYTNATTEVVRVRGPGGVPLSAPLSPSAVASMVRALNLHERYPAYLDAHGATSHGGLGRAALRFAAEDARTAYYVPGEPHAFIDDRDERGYRMVDAVLASPTPASRPTVGGHAIVAHQVTYRGAVLADVLVIGVATPGSAPRIVAWTPGAPDGKELREFESRAQMAAEFLHASAFESYLLQRIPLDLALTDAQGNPRFDTTGTRLATWVFNQGGLQGTRTDEVFGERAITGDVFATLDTTGRQLLARNARWLTRSTEAVDRGRAMAMARLITSAVHPAGELGATMAREVVTAIPAMLGQAWRFYDAVKAGDGTEAFFAFVDGYKAFLAIAPGPSAGAASARVAWLRASRGSPRLVRGTARAPAQALFEQRFVVRGVRARDATRVEDGILHIGGEPFIEHAGLLYRVRFDKNIGGWRLNRLGAPDSVFTGPAIERTAGGGWTYRRVGLLGGSGRGQPHGRRAGPYPPGRPPRELISLMRDPSLYNPEINALSGGQLRSLWIELRSRAGHHAERIVRAMRARDGRGAGTLTVAERAHWDEALRIARSNPAVPVNMGPAATPIDLSARRIDGMQRLRADEWPAELWYYTDIRGDMPPYHAVVHLPQLRASEQIVGVPLVSYAPATPSMQVVPRWYGVAREGLQLGQLLTSVRVDLRRLRGQATAAGRPAFDLYRVGPADSPAFVLRPAPTDLDPRGLRPLSLMPGDYVYSLPAAR
ncbi:dermonecrotic toxin domain-containing protein [Luteibacter yeojuensis]|uniref:Dermonecrotic toxin N-terminal domain-containing protein n=1 Tax=Luteibacter yeojuensis TaxID=345309 RepID=A0A0F3KZ08_9GAMM|nr:hypothetical protein VI08_08680 [Luteibacter yeojuensis]